MASQEFVYCAPVAGLSFAYELLVRPIDWRSIDRDPGRVSASALYRRTASVAAESTEYGPGRASPKPVEDGPAVAKPVRELIVFVPPPRGNHGKHQSPTLAEQILVKARKVFADLCRHMGGVKLDGTTAAGLKIDKPRAG